jgi:hypothetical protein
LTYRTLPKTQLEFPIYPDAIPERRAIAHHEIERLPELLEILDS